MSGKFLGFALLMLGAVVALIATDVSRADVRGFTPQFHAASAAQARANQLLAVRAHSARRRLVVGLNAGNFGPRGASDVKHVVRAVRIASSVGGGAVRDFTRIGVKVDVDFSGPYNAGGVAALNAAGWVSNALSFYRTYCTPAMCPWIEVLNEPGGTWFWGANATGQTNAVAYRSLVQQTWSAFHALYGARAPKVLATVDGSGALTFGHKWWTRGAAAFVNGIVVHPYGGTGSRASSAHGNRGRVTAAHRLTGKPIYATEVGWPTCPSCSPTNDSLQWSFAQQATNLTNFMTWARRRSFVAAAFYFNYRDFGGSNAYGIETQRGGRKPAYWALKRQAAR